MKKYYLLNVIFLSGLALLILNDHYFKWTFHNWLTGKASDFLGLLLLPMLISFFFPKRPAWNVLLSGLFFAFWKSPLSQALIDTYNSWTPIPISRVVDYTDLLALMVLPPTYWLIRNLPQYPSLHLRQLRLHPLVVLLPTVLAFMATSPRRGHYWTPTYSKMSCYKCTLQFKLSQSEILEQLQAEGIAVEVDSVPAQDSYIYRAYFENPQPQYAYPFYRVGRLVIGPDTIKNLQFALKPIRSNKTKVYLNGMDIPKDTPIPKLRKRFREEYQHLIEQFFSDHLETD